MSLAHAFASELPAWSLAFVADESNSDYCKSHLQQCEAIELRPDGGDDYLHFVINIRSKLF
jgi:hypothetical protein